jgi:uncharacterized membrane protein
MANVQTSRVPVRHELVVFGKERRQLQDRLADKITAFAGSMPFVYLHVVWFAAWLVVNETPWRFDPYPFGLLTLIVSLEAIFLSTFVMLSQNREATRSNVRSEIDFETNVLSEVWLEAIADSLNIDVGRVYAVARDRIDQAKSQQENSGSPGTTA